jgi:ubiquinone biosynthesis protein COQ9
MTDPTLPPSTRLRERLLDGVLVHAGRLGWGEAGLKAGAQEAGLSEGEVALAAPQGGVDLIDAFADRADQAMARALAGMDIAGMKVRARVRAAVRIRLNQVSDQREAVKRSVSYLALRRPQQAPGLAWRTADRIWLAIGDTSTDENYYSKRAILAGVYAATLTRFLNDDTPGAEATWAFLDDRIDNVMQFEKLKARVQTLGGLQDIAAAALGRWRYGPRGRQP